MNRILTIGRTAIAALFAVSMMLIVMLVAAVMAVPALAAGAPSETRATGARPKPAAARSVEQVEAPVQAVAATAVETTAQANEAELATHAKHLCVLKVVNLLSSQQLEALNKQAAGEGKITQDDELQLVILRGNNSFMVSSMDALKQAVHLRKDAWPEKAESTEGTLVEVYRFSRLSPKEGVALIKRTLPDSEAKVELRESSKAVIVEGSFKAVTEVLELLRQTDGHRPHFMVRKAFNIQIEPLHKSSGGLREQAGNDERERERER